MFSPHLSLPTMQPIWTEANSLMLFIVLVSVVIIYTYVFNTYKQYRGNLIDKASTNKSGESFYVECNYNNVLFTEISLLKSTGIKAK